MWCWMWHDKIQRICCGLSGPINFHYMPANTITLAWPSEPCLIPWHCYSMSPRQSLFPNGIRNMQCSMCHNETHDICWVFSVVHGSDWILHCSFFSLQNAYLASCLQCTSTLELMNDSEACLKDSCNSTPSIDQEIGEPWPSNHSFGIVFIPYWSSMIIKNTNEFPL